MASFPSVPFRYRGQHFLAGVVPYLSNCMIWAPLWANTFASYCDNQDVLAILSAKSFIIPHVMNLVWLITFQILSFNFTFTARHVPQINVIADSLIVSFPDVTVPPSRPDTLPCQLPVRPLHFLAKFNHASCLSTTIAQYIATSNRCT